MLYPNLNCVKDLLKQYDTVPVFYEVLSDNYTPIYIFNALKDTCDNCFILESVDNKNNWGRYSFIGINPKAEIKIKDGLGSIIKEEGSSTEKIDSPTEFLQSILNQYKSPNFPNRPKLTGGLIGYFGYDMVRYFEKTLVNIPEDDIGIPDCNLFLFDEIIAFDHLTNKTVVILNISSKDDASKQYESCIRRSKEISNLIKNYIPIKNKPKQNKEIEVKSNLTKKEFMDNVNKAKEHIKNGDIFQVVLSQRFEVQNTPDPFDVYRVLRSTNPSPYLYYFKTNDYQIVGASPEMLVNVTKKIISTKPIAGTICRGATEDEDKEFERQLLADPKERAEHTMLVDLGRNDVGKVSKFGTVEVTEFMKVDRYSKVMHLVSGVKGILQNDKTALDALSSVLPAGTLSGAPKVRAMELIDEIENKKRGLYGGTVGYLAFDGNMDTCIAIRTALFKDNKAYIQAGGGIVLDSVPENEFEESENKAFAVLNALKEACKL